MPHAAQKPCEWMSRCHSQGRPFQLPATGMAAGRALCSLVSCARSVWAPHCNNQIAASLLTFPQGKERNKCGCHQEIVSSHLLGNELNLCWLPHVPFPSVEPAAGATALFRYCFSVCLGWGQPCCGSACFSPLFIDSVWNILSATNICSGQMRSF